MSHFCYSDCGSISLRLTLISKPQISRSLMQPQLQSCLIWTRIFSGPVLCPVGADLYLAFFCLFFLGGKSLKFPTSVSWNYFISIHKKWGRGREIWSDPEATDCSDWITEFLGFNMGGVARRMSLSKQKRVHDSKQSWPKKYVKDSQLGANEIMQ